MTVVIPFLNGDNYIREAVASVFAQESEWELILVDDGSTDPSAGYAADLAARDARVRRLAHPGGRNEGVVRSRRLGLDAARGHYVLFLDHDDVLLPGALARMADVLDAHPSAGAVFAGTRHRHLREGREAIDFEFDFAPFPSGQVPRRKLSRDLIRSDAHHPQPSSSLWRRDTLAEVSRSTPIIRNSIYGDSALALTLLTRQDVCLLNETASIYRIHEQSMCAAGERDGNFSSMPWCRTRLDFLHEARAVLPLDTGQKLYLIGAILTLHGLGRLAQVARLLPRPIRAGLRRALGLGHPPNMRPGTAPGAGFA